MLAGGILEGSTSSSLKRVLSLTSRISQALASLLLPGHHRWLVLIPQPLNADVPWDLVLGQLISANDTHSHPFLCL